MNRLLILSVLVLAVVVGSLFWINSPKVAEVSLVSAAQSELPLSFTAEAFVIGKVYDISPETIARISSVNVQEGDYVAKGQILLTLDASELRSLLTQAIAARSTATSAIAEANSAFLSSFETFQSARNKALAGVSKAEAELKRIKRGSRSEAINQARHELDRLRIITAEMKQKLDRAERLYAEGAIAMVERDTARLNFQNAKAQADIAEDVLIELQNGPVSEELDSAKASLEIAKADLRIANGLEQDVKTRRAQVNTARSRAREADAEIERIQRLLEKCTLRAPVDGTVFRRNAEQGAISSPSAAAIRISTRSDLHIEAEIRSEDLGSMRLGSPVQILLPFGTGRPLKGRLERLSPVAESKPEAAIRTRIVRARIQILESPELFVPGMEVDIRGSNKQESVLCVPSDAVKVKDGVASVYVVSDGTVTIRKVTMGRSTADQTEILSGLKTGEQVVVSNTDLLKEGQKVRQANGHN